MSYESPIRKGVLSDDMRVASEEFDKWSSCLVGGYELEYKPIAESDTKLFSLPTGIIFTCEEDRAAYLLTWTEEYVDLQSILIPLIRRTMPSIIAIGVSPMTGPIGQIFTLQSRYLPDAIEEESDDGK